MRPGPGVCPQVLLGAVMLLLSVASAWALTYPSTPAEARAQYQQLYEALETQGSPAPELLATVDPSLRGKAIELAGRLQSCMQWQSPEGQALYLFLLQTEGGVAVALRCDEPLEGVRLGDPVRVLASLPANDDSTEFTLHGIIRQADWAAAPPPEARPESAPPPPEAPASTPAAAGLPSPTVSRTAVWDGLAAEEEASRPELPAVGMPQESIDRWKAWVARQNRKLTDLQLELTVRWVIIYSALAGIDHRLSFAMIKAESSFNPLCLSHAGAMGMTQLMPCNLESMRVSNPWNVQQNLRGGIQLLSKELHKFSDRSNYEQCILGLAAYNAGPNAVRKYGGVPPYRETQAYVKKVSQQFYDLVKAGYP